MGEEKFVQFFTSPIIRFNTRPNVARLTKSDVHRLRQVDYASWTCETGFCIIFRIPLV